MNGYFHQTKSGRWEGQIELPRGQDGNRRHKSIYGTCSECEFEIFLLAKKMKLNGASDRIIITEWEPHPDFLDERD